MVQHTFDARIVIDNPKDRLGDTNASKLEEFLDECIQDQMGYPPDLQVQVKVSNLTSLLPLLTMEEVRQMKLTDTRPDIQKLRADLRMALDYVVPGPWGKSGNNVVECKQGCPTGLHVCEVSSSYKRDGIINYLMLADPTNMLALLEELDRLERAKHEKP